ncbi:MAG: guanylate kinase [Thermostichales cyanobacterium BF4_bins_65]
MPDLVTASPPDSQPTQPRLGRLWVITGPSGVGKGTLIQALRQRHPELHFSVSVTTRPARPGEQEGVNYFFRSREEFMRLEAEGGLLEWAEYADHLYGTPAAPVQSYRQAGQDVILEIELKGARQVAERCPEAIRIFIQPPSMAELERRLRERGVDSEASIQSRLRQAETELSAAHEFDYVILNDDLDTALAQLERIIFGDPGQS